MLGSCFIFCWVLVPYILCNATPTTTVQQQPHPHHRQQILTTMHVKQKQDWLDNETKTTRNMRHGALIQFLCPVTCRCRWNTLSGNIETVDCSNRRLQFIPILPKTARHVYLQNNSISRISCSDFSHLFNLITLNLTYNNVSSLYNCTFLSTRSLLYLYIAHGTLTSLESGAFLPLNNLIILDLSANAIRELHPRMMSTLSQLRYLNLYRNTIATLKNDTFWGLDSLLFLSLQRNTLLYRPENFEGDCFRGLDRLISLHLQGNQPEACGSDVEYPASALGILTSLRNLSLDGCPVTPGPGFLRLTNLTRLDFSTNFYQDNESFCSMESSIPEDFFRNFATARPFHLNMSACGVTHIPPLLFQPLPLLFSLDLSHNELLTLEKFRIGSQGLVNSSLAYLHLDDIVHHSESQFIATEITNVTFQYLKQTQLKYISLRRNRIANIDPRAILDIRRTLEYFIVRDNIIQNAFFVKSMFTMEKLIMVDARNQMIPTLVGHGNNDMHGNNTTQENRNSNPQEKLQRNSGCHVNKKLQQHNNVQKNNYRRDHLIENNGEVGGNGAPMVVTQTSEFPTSKHEVSSDVYDPCDTEDHCSEQHSDLLKKLKYILNAESSGTSNELTIPLPIRLTTLYLSNNRLLSYPIPPIRVINNKVLRHLEYSNNMASCWYGPLQGAPALQYLDLSKNQCSFMNLQFFMNVANLTTLLLHNNILGNALHGDDSGRAFSTLTNLRVLDLSSNFIKRLSPSAFRNNVRLQTLNISNNALGHFDPDLGTLSELLNLDLSTNLLNGLSDDNCHDLSRIKMLNPNFTVNLHDNKLEISCNVITFLKVVVSNPDLLVNPYSLRFTYTNGTVVQYDKLAGLIPQLERTCQAQSVFMAVLVLFFVHVCVLTVVAVFFYNRWKLKYLYYIGKRRMHIGDVELNYNLLAQAFIIYDQEERLWRRFLQQTFLPRMRDRGLTYILGEVDFEGGNQRSQVAGAIVSTRKTLVLLSRDLLDDSERRDEINLAIMHELRLRSPVIVPVLLEPVAMTPDCPGIQVFLQNHVSRCLVYNDTPVFWDRLVREINNRD